MNHDLLFVFMEMWCSVVNLIAILLIGRAVNNSDINLRRMWILIILANFLLISDAAITVFNGSTTDSGVIVLKASSFIVSFLHCVIIWKFFETINKMVHRKEKLTWDVATIIVAVSMVICVSILLSNYWTHVSYYFDENNVYIAADTAFLSFSMPIISMVTSAIYITRHRSAFYERVRRALILALVIIISCCLVQLKMGGFAMLNLAISMDLLIFMLEYYIGTYEARNASRLKEINATREIYEETTK